MRCNRPRSITQSSIPVVAGGQIEQVLRTQLKRLLFGPAVKAGGYGRQPLQRIFCVQKLNTHLIV
ncbi:hypothetical protein AUP74_01700 [Microbulbifer aggregans]|uniref:Uncharacterized protein n=1 Tax=Microbulbifer aggregans TaxID=1769779 RepID=A0A1C9W7K9_9GAMM|nr:hypothetical protein AUP74_01700 [Microbulbifer aggregans]